MCCPEAEPMLRSIGRRARHHSDGTPVAPALCAVPSHPGGHGTRIRRTPPSVGKRFRRLGQSAHSGPPRSGFAGAATADQVTPSRGVAALRRPWLPKRPACRQRKCHSQGTESRGSKAPNARTHSPPPTLLLDVCSFASTAELLFPF